jgi:hypothetical protein
MPIRTIQQSHKIEEKIKGERAEMTKLHDEFFRKGSPRDDALVVKAQSPMGIQKILNDVATGLGVSLESEDCGKCEYTEALGDKRAKLRQVGFQYSLQTEAICTNGSFLVGYSDIILTLTRFIGYEPSRVIGKCGCAIIIECKPELADVFGTVRQLKTYMKHRNAQVGVIATYSDLDNDTIQALKNEHIAVSKFEDPPK